jgi:hypothetical protein
MRKSAPTGDDLVAMNAKTRRSQNLLLLSVWILTAVLFFKDSC